MGADGGADELRWLGLHGFSVLWTRGHVDVHVAGSDGRVRRAPMVILVSGSPVDRVPRLVGGTERLYAGMGDQWAGGRCSGRDEPALRTSVSSNPYDFPNFTAGRGNTALTRPTVAHNMQRKHTHLWRPA